MKLNRILSSMVLLWMVTTSVSAQSTAPVVTTNPFVLRGVTAALGRSTVTGERITETGFCWSSETKEPTINDSKTTDYITSNGKLYHIQGLTPATFYYVRAYAINSDGAVGYGKVVKVVTLPKGDTRSIYNANDASAEQTARITAALDEVVSLYNTWQGIKGLTITCNYSSGTPTADCSYGGWMRMGPNASYQRTGTILHEVNHAVGVGTTGLWYDNSALRAETSRGLWLGERANQVLHFLEGNDGSTMTGDNTHMWPYGINGAQEDNGTQLLYISNVTITHALGEDGLTPTTSYDNGYPYYSFDCEDSTKYYIKGSTESTGLYTSYLACGKSMVITMSETPNDSAAWYISFNPNLGMYMFKNVATGRYLSHTTASDGSAVMRGIKTTTVSDSHRFQLVPARYSVSVGGGATQFTSKPISFCFPSYQCMIMSNGKPTPGSYSLSNSATAEHWLIMTETEKDNFQRIMDRSTIDELTIGGKSYEAFDVYKNEYNIGLDPDVTADQLKIAVTLNSRFEGTYKITDVTEIPGTATVELLDKDNNVENTYTLHFYPNIVYTWDGEATTGSASKPNKWGWGTTATSSIIWGTANSLNSHFMDPGKGTTYAYSDYTLGERAYETNRMLMLNYMNGGETYYYTFKGLEPGTEYALSYAIGYAANETEETPAYQLDVVNVSASDTIPQLNNSDASILLTSACSSSATEKNLTTFDYTFTTPSDITTDSEFTIQLTSQQKHRAVLANFYVMKLGFATITEDINGDGAVDSQDVLKVYDIMKNSTNDKSADVNGDGNIDSQDVLKVYEYMKNH